MLDDKIDLYKFKVLYQVLRDILVDIEGNNHSCPCCVIDYQQTQKITLPLSMLPLLHASGVCVQVGLALLPYSIASHKVSDYSEELKEYIDFFKNKPLEYGQYSTEFSKYLFQDMLRIIPTDTIENCLIKTKNNQTDYSNAPQTIILYDKQKTNIPSVKAIEIDDYQAELLAHNDSKFILLGDISYEKHPKLKKILKDKIIYGIAPPENINSLCHLEKRMFYFSQSILAGTINIHLPFINHFFDYGLSPINFYYRLYRSPCPQEIIHHALCLMNLKHPNQQFCCEFNYIRLVPHTEIAEPTKEIIEKVDYLHLLTCDNPSNR